MDEPTVLTKEDVDTCVEKLMSEEIESRTCEKCSKKFFPNYDQFKCDECFFSQFPKEQVKEFYKSILQGIGGYKDE